MKALSIRQPYAALIVAGIKNIENRSWMSNHSGPVVIVSTRTAEPQKWWKHEREKVKRLGIPFPEKLSELDGYALGVVDFYSMIVTTIEGTTETNYPEPDTLDKTWWIPDMVGFIFENPRALATPIPVKGMLGLYTLPAEIEARIVAQLKR